MTAIEMRLLGPFEIRDGAGRPLPVRARKNRALLAVLALSPAQAMPRERMTSLVWSDRGDAQARSSLRQALLGLRADLAPADVAALDISDDKASINLLHVGVDVLEFQRLAASGDVEALRRARALYRGELLADTFIQDPAFADWLSAERQRLADLASSVIERLLAHETGQARVDLARELVALDPLREASHRLLMQAYHDAGERALALRQYEICRAILRDELQIAPGELTEALRRRFMGDNGAATKAAGNGAAHATGNGTAYAASSSAAYAAGNGAAHTASNSAARAAAPFNWQASGPALDDRPLVAVLPFQAFSSDPELENFCDGLAEDITTGLSRIRAIRVVARSTMFTYKHRAVDIRDVGRDLDARYVLEGSARSSGKAIRVAAQLIDAVSGHHIWADQFDRPHGDMFEQQNDITRSVVASVQSHVALNEGHAGGDAGEHGKASRQLARAWRAFLGLTDASLSECKRLAGQALAVEPGNATAHRMLAVAVYHQVYMGFVPWRRQAIDELFAHARLSIESEGADEYCHWAMECAYLLRGQHELAAASLRRALEINPNFALAHGSLATVLAWSGAFEESIASNELALRVNPQDPSNFFRHFGLALAHYLAGRPQQALTHARIVAQARDGWWLGQIVYAAALVQAGRQDEARRVVTDLAARRPAAGNTDLAMLPFAREADRQRLADDLASAGYAG